ncbi:hypothetical protein MtrunA17_Chr7g0250361 [Medicago truncatula]|uniref:Transmembrane protein n=1 Tax=Medicago truncatula TaxID=3880 RepID=A0A396H3Y5_MEDTR|nr:hypothetical protein MtrunA17_Chr7g0250361 [Medicago truncatula]
MMNLLKALLHLKDEFITITTAVEPLLLLFMNESVFHVHFEVVIGAIEREKEIGANLFICTIFPYEIFKVKLLLPQSLQLKKQQKTRILVSLLSMYSRLFHSEVVLVLSCEVAFPPKSVGRTHRIMINVGSTIIQVAGFIFNQYWWMIYKFFTDLYI